MHHRRMDWLWILQLARSFIVRWAPSVHWLPLSFRAGCLIPRIDAWLKDAAIASSVKGESAIPPLLDIARDIYRRIQVFGLPVPELRFETRGGTAEPIAESLERAISYLIAFKSIAGEGRLKRDLIEESRKYLVDVCAFQRAQYIFGYLRRFVKAQIRTIHHNVY